MALTELLFKFDRLIWMFDALALCLFVFIAIKNKMWYSSLLTQIVVVSIGGIMVLYQPYLNSLYSPSLEAAVNFAWYIGFTVFDIIAICTIYFCHKRINIGYGVVANYNIFAYFVLGLLQILRYSERLIWNSDWLKAFYKYAILAINLTTVSISLVIAVLALFSVYKIEYKSRRLAWII